MIYDNDMEEDVTPLEFLLEEISFFVENHRDDPLFSDAFDIVLAYDSWYASEVKSASE